MSTDLLRRMTFALLDPARAVQAASALTGCDELAALEGLYDLLESPPNDNAGCAAIRALSASLQPLAHQALRKAARRGNNAVRCAALHALRLKRDSSDASLFEERLRCDHSVRVRRECLRGLAQLAPDQRWPILAALSDPVWRIRQAAVLHLLAWERETPGLVAQVRHRCAEDNSLIVGALRYLEFLASPQQVPPPRSTPVEPPFRQASWWDDDPPVLLRNLRNLTDGELRSALPLLPALLTLQDGRPVTFAITGVHRLVADTLCRLGQQNHVAAALALFDEPRRPGMEQWASRLGAASIRKDISDEGEEVPAHIRRSQELTREQAEVLWLQPERETSWLALKRAAELLEKPLTDIAPALPWGRRPSRLAASDEMRPALRWQLPDTLASNRPLGQSGLMVSRLGLSGRYGLPERGFQEAIEEGVNLFFWEPGYHTQTHVWQLLPPALKDRLVVVSGSFQADARSIRRDLESTLRALRVERLGVFLLFWVRSAGRLDEETLEELEQIRHEGLVQAVGLSTHLRPLAVQALRDGWQVLMVRHSLAHRGAEEHILPMAHELGTGLLTFSALCYGRLLGRVRAADCYRYSLSQPGVSACWMAPRTLEQLRENLEVLRQPAFDVDQIAELRRHGDARYREHRAFVEWIRSR
jgi:aryl-alcohol dehydrogenase-like predicted oxidoreductase